MSITYVQYLTSSFESSNAIPLTSKCKLIENNKLPASYGGVVIVKNQMIVAVKGIIIKDGKVLIIKRNNHARVGGGTWECPGGKVEFGEDLESAMKREAKEEAGLEIQINKILYATSFQTDPTRQVVLITYLCHCEAGDILLSDEHSEYLWATKDQLKTLLPKNILADFEKNDIFTLLKS